MAGDERSRDAVAATRNLEGGINVPAIVNPKAGF
jgi:hypothetical protein